MYKEGSFMEETDDLEFNSYVIMGFQQKWQWKDVYTEVNAC